MVFISLLADLTLGSILVLLWAVRRNDRHALYWGVGQIMLGLAAAIWSMSSQQWWAHVLIIMTGTVGLGGYVTGTLQFCGRPIDWRLQIGGWVGYALLKINIASFDPGLSNSLALVMLGSVFAWCAWQLLRRKHVYYVMSWVFALRAMANFAFASNMLIGTSLEILFAIGFCLKVIASLGLIHAVLHEAERRSLATVNGLGHGFMITDAKGVIHFASRKLAEYTGVGSVGDLVGQHMSTIVCGNSPDLTSEWFKRVTEPGTPLPCISEVIHRRNDGVEFPVEIISVPYEDRGQMQMLSQVIDISERKALELARQRAMMLDELTGLLNRNILRQMLGSLLADCATSGKSLALLLIDLDRFRRINDTLGHSAGDKLLRLVSERLLPLKGSHDLLARFGGDEFAFVLVAQNTATIQKDADEFARTILSTLSSPFLLEASRITLKASVGVAFGGLHGRDAEQLISAADVALYAAKDAGRNRHCIFDDRMNLKARDALLVDEALQRAIANNELWLVYQPIVEARSRRLRKVEALLRWSSPSLGFVAPDRFIPIAEESGQIVKIGTWVLQEAARQARIWEGRTEDSIRVTVNVSAAQLADSNFMNVVDDAIACSGVDPAKIEIEMTERVLIEEPATVMRLFETLHAKGMSTSLDDFGTGYSSLSYLTRFQLRTLKIDRAFVHEIEHDVRNLALVHAIITMGHNLGMQIVAEGIETEEQARLLADLGCEYLQGYLISRPVTPDELFTTMT